MRFSYDPEVDVLMIELVDNQAERFTGGTRLPFGDAVADLDDRGTILSIEIENASQRYSLDVLMANQATYGPMTLTEAAAIAGVTADALKKAIQRGRLKARQFGGSWMVTGQDLDTYMNQRWKREPIAAS